MTRARARKEVDGDRRVQQIAIGCNYQSDEKRVNVSEWPNGGRLLGEGVSKKNVRPLTEWENLCRPGTTFRSGVER